MKVYTVTAIFLHTADHTHTLVTYLNGPRDFGHWLSLRICAQSDERAKEIAAEFMECRTYLRYEVVTVPRITA